LLISGGGTSSLTSARSVLDRSLRQLEALGIRAHSESRFPKGLHLLDEAIMAESGLKPDEDVDWCSLAEVLCDAQELTLIAGRSHLVSSHPKMVRAILKGSLQPWEDSPTRPRDLQLELFFTALFEIAGFDPIVAEPDIRVENGDLPFAIAVKRVSSMAMLDERVREAIGQIQRSRVPGFVALGLSPVARDRSKIVVAMSPSALADAGRSLTAAVIDKLEPIAEHRHTPDVLGYMVWLCLPALLPGRSTGSTSDFRVVCTVAPGHERRTRVDQIQQQVLDAVGRVFDAWAEAAKDTVRS
jgi:hypothetical protein